MSGIFNYENSIFGGINKAIDCVFLSFLWIIFSIPIITIGASTTALYYTVNKSIRHGRSYVWRAFWESFKSNFKQSTIIWLIFLALFIILGLDMRIVYKSASPLFQVLKTVFFVFFNIFMVWCVYIFAYIARFSIATKAAFRNSILILIANLLWSVLIWAVSVVGLILMVVAALIFPLAWFVVPTLAMLLINLILERIFRKYMSPEDLEKEKARNGK